MKFNFRNRYLVITIRVLLGLMFLFSGVSGILAASNGMQGVPEVMVISQWQLWDMGIFQLIKITEIVAGIMFITGFLPALALLFVSPICVGLIAYDLSVAPDYSASFVVISVMTAYLGYAYWDKYKAIFQRQ
ncbi:hypothetical protein K8R04_04075 [Candidatus Uhrbacteria bacterium]|nr:hypothetical protein [Candidatus Uhrbacteria bacterium]